MLLLNRLMRNTIRANQSSTSFLFRNGSGPHLDSISLNSYMLSYILYFEKYKFAKSGFR